MAGRITAKSLERQHTATITLIEKTANDIVNSVKNELMNCNRAGVNSYIYSLPDEFDVTVALNTNDMKTMTFAKVIETLINDNFQVTISKNLDKLKIVWESPISDDIITNAKKFINNNSEDF